MQMVTVERYVVATVAWLCMKYASASMGLHNDTTAHISSYYMY